MLGLTAEPEERERQDAVEAAIQRILAHRLPLDNGVAERRSLTAPKPA